MPRKKIKLGDKLRDTVTGYVGTATAKYEYLNGCVRYALEATMGEDGKPREFVFDEERLERPGGAKPATTGASGGPHDEPTRSAPLGR